jgi:hypothetical protein
MRWIALIVIAACSGAPTPVVRHAPYGPSFSYLGRAEIKTEMHHFAAGIVELDRVLATKTPRPVDQREVLRILDEIDRAAGKLEKGGETTGHVELDRELPRFRRDIEAARSAVDRESPSYFLAAGVVSSCVYCHH